MKEEKVCFIDDLVIGVMTDSYRIAVWQVPKGKNPVVHAEDCCGVPVDVIASIPGFASLASNETEACTVLKGLALVLAADENNNDVICNSLEEMVTISFLEGIKYAGSLGANVALTRQTMENLHMSK